MGTLNPYRAPFLDGNWIINATYTIGVNHFQLKLISKMFEMFVLLINEINSHSFCFVTCFVFIFTRGALPHRGLLHTIFCIAYLRICRGNLLWEFAVAICRLFFCIYISESFFVYMSKFCLYGGKPFLYVRKTFWLVRFSLLTVFLLVIAVVVMGHRTYTTSLKIQNKLDLT